VSKPKRLLTEDEWLLTEDEEIETRIRNKGLSKQLYTKEPNRKFRKKSKELREEY
jgi:hypothetical protein